jgi:replicative DNA helicase
MGDAAQALSGRKGQGMTDLDERLAAGDMPSPDNVVPFPGKVREPGSDDDEWKPEEEDFRVATPYELMQAVYKRAVRQEPEPRVLSTLSNRLDRLTGGYRPRTTTILGARSNWGKTKYTVALWVQAVLRNLRPLIIGGEDSRQLYEQRYVCQRAGIGATAARDNSLSPEELSNLLYTINGATDDERRVPMFLSAIGKPIEWAMKAAEKLWAEHVYDFVVLDHLQQFRSSRQDVNRDGYTRVTHVGQVFGEFIKTVGGKGERGPAGLILSQFKQGLPDDQWPTRGDLRYAGAVAEAADTILLGHAEKTKETQAQGFLRERGQDDDEPEQLRRFIVANKARNGVAGGKAELPWDIGTASFELEDEA